MTPYGDIDAFIIVDKESDVARVKHAMEGWYNLFFRIFDHIKDGKPINQLYFDPIGINPAKLCGTVSQIIEDVKEFGDPSKVNSLFSARVVYSNPNDPKNPKNAYRNLIEELRKDKQLYPGQLARTQYYYNEAVNGFSGSRSAQKINLKRDILRPLDFILMGLREEFGLFDDNGEHVLYTRTLRDLHNKGDLSTFAYEIFLNTYQIALTLRNRKHFEARGEDDDIQVDDHVKKIIGATALLRGLTAQRNANLTNGTCKFGSPFYINLADPAFKDSMFSQVDIDFSLAEFVGDIANHYKKSVKQEDNGEYYQTVANWLLAVEQIKKIDKDNPAVGAIKDIIDEVGDFCLNLRVLDTREAQLFSNFVSSLLNLSNNPSTHSHENYRQCLQAIKHLLNSGSNHELIKKLENLLASSPSDAYTNAISKIEGYIQSKSEHGDVLTSIRDKVNELKTRHSKRQENIAVVIRSLTTICEHVINHIESDTVDKNQLHNIYEILNCFPYLGSAFEDKAQALFVLAENAVKHNTPANEVKYLSVFNESETAASLQQQPIPANLQGLASTNLTDSESGEKQQRVDKNYPPNTSNANDGELTSPSVSRKIEFINGLKDRLGLRKAAARQNKPSTVVEPELFKNKEDKLKFYQEHYKGHYHSNWARVFSKMDAYTKVLAMEKLIDHLSGITTEVFTKLDISALSESTLGVYVNSYQDVWPNTFKVAKSNGHDERRESLIESLPFLGKHF
jgi:hypothetical protein